MIGVYDNRVEVWQLARRCWGLLLLQICFLMNVGCGNPSESSVATERLGSTPEGVVSESNSRNALPGKLKFKTSDGDVAFSLKPEPDGAKLVDAEEHEIARFNLSGAKLKVKGPDDIVLGYVIASDGKYKIEDADQENELWKLQRQSDGDWKLEDGKDQLICKIKLREYGFEIEDDADNSIYKVKLKEGKTSLRDRSDQTVYYTKDQVPTIAVTCLGFESIDSLPIKTALMTMLIIFGSK